MRNRAVLDRQVGTAHAARREPHVHVVGTDGAQRDVVDHERLADRAQRGGAHQLALNTSGRLSAWRMPGEKWISAPSAIE